MNMKTIMAPKSLNYNLTKIGYFDISHLILLFSAYVHISSYQENRETRFVKNSQQ